MEALSAALWLSALAVADNGGGNLPLWLLPWVGLPLIALLLPLVLIDLDHLWLPEPLCRWGCCWACAVGLRRNSRSGESSDRCLFWLWC